MKYSTIEEALEELRQGKIILVTDDPDRENEGDFICAALFLYAIMTAAALPLYTKRSAAEQRI